MSGPTWADSESLRRYPIFVNLISAGSDGPFEFAWQAPPDWDHFWDNITDATDGDDIYVTEADGQTVVVFDLDVAASWVANRAASIDISGVAYTGSDAGGALFGLLWLYWGHSGTPTALGGSPTTVSQRAAQSHLYKPGRFDPVVLPTADRSALQIVEKDPVEEVLIWFDITSLLGSRTHPYQRSSAGHGVSWWTFTVTKAGAVQASMFDAADGRYITLPGQGGQERHLIGHTVKAGSTTDKTLAELTVRLTDGTTRQVYCQVNVTTVQEA